MDRLFHPLTPPAPHPFKEVALARKAMATRFEIVLYGDDPVNLRAAGEEALDEIDRIEDQLSFYRPGSEVSALNRRAIHQPTKVSPSVFRLLERGKALSKATDGAFDITVAPLLQCWGFVAGSGRLPDPDVLQRARSVVSMDGVELHPDHFLARFVKKDPRIEADVQVDLGSIGKGYALERAAEILRENGVTQAFLHGGTSSIVAIGSPPGEEGWKVALQHPAIPSSLLGTVTLKDTSLSVSGVHGKSFEAGGRWYGHVIDPRTGEPVEGALMAAVALPSATETDALSTALLVLGAAGLQRLAETWPEISARVIVPDANSEEGVSIHDYRWPE
jgi:thiamine biosynthesis lipoprotein